MKLVSIDFKYKNHCLTTFYTFQMKRGTTFSMKEVKVLEFAMMKKTAQYLQDVSQILSVVVNKWRHVLREGSQGFCGDNLKALVL